MLRLATPLPIFVSVFRSVGLVLTAMATRSRAPDCDPMSAVTWEDQQFSLVKLISTHSRQFPIVAKVTEGHYGDTNLETLSAGEVFRFHTWGRHSRILARDVPGCYYSIPEAYPIAFRPVVNNVVGPPVSLAQLLDDFELPVEMKMDPAGVTDLRLRDDLSKIMRFGNLTAEQVYQERYLKANLLDNGRVLPDILIIPTYVSAKVALADDTANPDRWRTLTREWHKATRNLPFSKVSPNTDIILFSASQVEACRSADMYELLRPQHILQNENLEAGKIKELQTYASLQSARQSCALAGEATLNMYETLDFHQVSANPPPPPPPAPPRVPRDPPMTKPKPKQTRFGKTLLDGGSKGNVGTGTVPVSRLQADPSAAVDIATMSEVPADVSHLTIKQLGDCLRLLRMGHHVKQFRDQQVDGRLLLSLDEDLMREELKLNKLEAKKLHQFANKGYRPV